MSEPLIVLIGAGGIGCPAALALGKSGASRLRVVDEDRVEVSNLHRQVLFEPSDVGRPKTATFAERLRQHFPSLDVSPIEDRVLPDNAWDLLEDAAVVIDATDNYPSRFVVADAARLMGIPVVHAAAVKWQATVMACSSRGEPCYRCLFEDLPDGPVVDCACSREALSPWS